ncbi:MAG: hypothetical protein QOH01_2492 [Verrucomicrobiota bacterium]|jgi:hypothetical protein
MKLTSGLTPEKGSTLVVALCVLTIISAVAAAVLANANTRYNAGSRAIKAWKEALYAAEAGGDLAFNEIRKPYLSTPGTPFSSGWLQNDASAPAPNPNSAVPPDYAVGYGNSAVAFGTSSNLSAKITVDKLGSLPGNASVYYYRIRSVGIAQMFGLKRTGMNDALQDSSGTHFGAGTGARGNGDSLLRKIDFNYDHFLATYGYGDALPSAAATSSNGKAAVAVSDPNHGQVTRRVELVAVPMMPIEGAVKTLGGNYSFPYIDSFNSANGAYPGQSCATTPTCTTYADARNGNVVDGGSSFNGTVYGDVTTNGGNADKNHVSGVIDNNVPVAPVSNLPVPAHGAYEAQNSGDITAPAVTVASRDATQPANNQQQTTFWYHYSNLGNVDINPAAALTGSPAVPAGGVVETNVNIVVDSDVTGKIAVKRGVKLKVYFSGNASGKADSYDNTNVDTAAANKAYVPTYTDNGVAANPRYTLSGYTLSTNNSPSDHMWFIGEGTNQDVTLGSGSPATEQFVWYTPNANFTVNGNPDFIGAMVVKSFTGNGNNTMHFDKQLLTAGIPQDYRIASYIEDVR